MALRLHALALATTAIFGTHASAQTAAGPASVAKETKGETALPEVRVDVGRELPPAYNPPVANTATKIDAPLRDIPQTVNVVPQSLMRDQAVRSMEDALKTVPGIGLSHGDGQRDQVTIRGFSAIADQFVDGMRDDALYFRDLSNVEQVEVLKGPASVLYGRGSSGGLINRITKKPGVERSEVGVQYGSWNRRRAEVDLARNDAARGLAFRITGAVERGDGYRGPQFIEREAVAPSLSLRLGPRTDLLLQAEYLADRRITDFGIPAYQGRPVDVPARTYYGAANARDVDYTQTRVAAAGFTLSHRFDDRWSVRNAFRHYDYSLDRNNTLVGSVDESALTASLTRGNVRRQEDGFFNQTEVVHKATLAGMPHQFLYGVEVGRQTKDQFFRNQAGVATVSLFDPVLPVLPFAATTPPSSDNVGVMNVTSAYVQDLATLTRHWKALVGVRYDRFEQETRERVVGRPNLSRTDAAWSPRAGVVYQPTRDQAYYASFSKSFQPSAEAFPLAASNAQIAPEETTNHEIGAKFDLFDGKASAGASLFRLERTNIKAVDPATRRLVPLGVQRTDGIELTFSGHLPGDWQLWSGYAYLDSRMTSSVAVDAGQAVQGKRATLTPRHSANLWLVKALGDGFGAGAGVTYVGDRYANAGNTVTLPAYTTVDAMLYYRAQRLSLQLNLANLFDRHYIVSGHGTSPNLNLPGAPRSVLLTARYAF